LAEESLLQVSPEPKWYEELMRLRDLGRVSKTPRSQLEPFKPRSPFKGLLRSNIATEMINPPALTPDWHEEEFLELQKDRGKNLERFLNWDYKNMKPGETFTKANQWDIYQPTGSPDRKKLPKTLYHGSPKFRGDRFDLGKTQARDHGYYGEGVYLTSNPGTASQYSDPKGGMFHLEPKIKGASPEVIPVYANIKNPLYIDDLTPEVFKKLGEATKYFVPPEKKERFVLMFEKYGDSGYTEKALKHLQMPSSYKSSLRETQLNTLLTDFEDTTGLNRSALIQKAGYDSTIVGDGREVIIYDPRRIKSMFNQGTFNPLTGDLHTNLGFGSNYASRA